MPGDRVCGQLPGHPSRRVERALAGQGVGEVVADAFAGVHDRGESRLRERSPAPRFARCGVEQVDVVDPGAVERHLPGEVRVSEALRAGPGVVDQGAGGGERAAAEAVTGQQRLRHRGEVAPVQLLRDLQRPHRRLGALLGAQPVQGRLGLAALQLEGGRAFGDHRFGGGEARQRPGNVHDLMVGGQHIAEEAVHGGDGVLVAVSAIVDQRGLEMLDRTGVVAGRMPAAGGGEARELNRRAVAPYLTEEGARGYEEVFLPVMDVTIVVTPERWHTWDESNMLDTMVERGYTQDDASRLVRRPALTNPGCSAGSRYERSCVWSAGGRIPTRGDEYAGGRVLALLVGFGAGWSPWRCRAGRRLGSRRSSAAGVSVRRWQACSTMPGW